jgi:hypothetical protein
MARDLNEKDYKAFRDFEEKLLNLKDSGIVYKKEDELEIEIKKEALFSHFSKEKTEATMEKLGLKFEDLVNHQVYIEIYKFLENGI